MGGTVTLLAGALWLCSVLADGGGPTHHEYKINDHQFMTSYPNFLQSFEFYLLANCVASHSILTV